MDQTANEIASANEQPAERQPALPKRRSKPAPDPEKAAHLIRRLNDLLSASDYFGRHAALTPDEKIAKLFLASAEDKAKSDFNCTASDEVRRQVPVLFQAIAGVIEENCGLMIQSSAEINVEGFGRGLLYSGRVILVMKSLRAGFPFPFTSLDKTVAYGVACIEEGLAFLDKYKELTAVHGLLSLEG
ncbi:DUF269 domain-containing protein [Paenibacillus sp. URB8-2]|uniref:DUF269 domain-containing protein n=1 Tax=Paenibacillus sp. URB8-2 TaxID=2741301 RepID=UPI0015BEE959|nr:DUF269 domain-containing protein [Paenibacillus sp. URB8-2]BCG60599.1 hypothetical protein PUR_40240 [Paenibacillus sp. URB8-2]